MGLFSSSKRLDIQIFSELYRLMFKIRQAEIKVAEIYPSDKIQSPVHLSIGQEAVAAGVCRALRPEDHLYGTYRGHGIFIAKGGDLKKLFAELYGKDTGCARGKGGSMHLVAPEIGLMACSAVVASTIPVAVGDALAAKMQKKNRVSVAFFGDGAVDEGVFFESLNFAALKKLPVIFVCENNHFAIHSKVSDRHKNVNLCQYGENLGVPGSRFDGNDVEVVYQTMSDAVEKVRGGGDPVLLEYMTYRLYEHVGPMQDLKESYRDPESLQDALKSDPLEKTKKGLVKNHRVSEDFIRQWEEEIHGEIKAAVEFAEASPFPAAKRLYEDLFEVKKR